MKITSAYLYDLLPAYYRVLDDEKGEPLKKLIDILAREAGIVEEDIDRLYNNWFIETCDEWVVPYIGDLLGVKGLHNISDNAQYSQRAYIANTLAYRRRKGTAPVLEQLAFDITGWRTRVVEFFQLLQSCQNLNHLRLHNKVTVDMRQMNQLDLLNGPFETQSHTVDVRRIKPGLGKYNIQNLGLYIWRLQSYPLTQANARRIEGPGIPEGAYTFNSLGLDTQLFLYPDPENEITHLAEEINVPGLLRRRGLFEELESMRTNAEFTPFFFRASSPEPIFQITTINQQDNETLRINNETIAICNLSEWHTASNPFIQVAVDPELGRLVLSNPENVSEVLVTYNYGFSADVGGGPYDRKASFIDLLKDLPYRDSVWVGGVGKNLPEDQIEEVIFDNLTEAIAEWEDSNQRIGLITIMDSRTYEEDIDINIASGRQLYIIAASWRDWELEEEDSTRRFISFNAKNIRPHILGNIHVRGIQPDESSGGELILNGLLIEGHIEIARGSLGSCVIEHCTIVPGVGEVRVENQENNFHLSLHRSICGPIRLNSTDAQLSITDCIIDYKPEVAIQLEQGHLKIEQSTVWGTVDSQTIEASNCIFNDPIHIDRLQTGCVRFSYLPLDSEAPHPFRCQPRLEIQSRLAEHDFESMSEPEITNLREDIQRQVLQFMLPVYNSSTYGHHAYAQLSSATPEQLTTGADNAAEMGVYNHLEQPQRLENLRIALEEYLPLGLEAGVLFIT